MGRGKWSAKDYEILPRWFKLRKEKEGGCFTAGPKGQLINESQRKTLPRKALLLNLKCYKYLGLTIFLSQATPGISASIKHKIRVFVCVSVTRTPPKQWTVAT
ncbi:hypothetical protein AVEN_67462-1 [Araneus ventricosus]|uniref:Uncharacterized protein n=1 Tax=Araneus ventricosus TaxID=182803 RepID=A0A4Y2VPB6_ARAVE|nr:hypothetical protein AVEN_67462-1 [Araneus ventricosus]